MTSVPSSSTFAVRRATRDGLGLAGRIARGSAPASGTDRGLGGGRAADEREELADALMRALPGNTKRCAFEQGERLIASMRRTSSRRVPLCINSPWRKHQVGRKQACA